MRFCAPVDRHLLLSFEGSRDVYRSKPMIDSIHAAIRETSFDYAFDT